MADFGEYETVVLDNCSQNQIQLPISCACRHNVRQKRRKTLDYLSTTSNVFLPNATITEINYLTFVRQVSIGISLFSPNLVSFSSFAMTAQLHAQIPTCERTAPGSVNLRPAEFPNSASAPSPDLDVNQTAVDVVKALNESLGKADYASVSKLFVEQGFWRDHLALTWEFRTAQGPRDILSLLEASSQSRDGFRLKSIALDTSSALRAPRVAPLDGEGQVAGIHFFINIETVIGSGNGVGRLVDDNGTWKLFSLYTALKELNGHEEKINERRPTGVEHGEKQGRRNWTQRREQETRYQDTDPAVLIIGKNYPSLFRF